MSNPEVNWSTDEVPVNERTDAWQAVLSRSYKHDWHIPYRLPGTFNAQIRRYDFAGLGIVEAVCDPCVGQRCQTFACRDDELYVVVQLTRAGREQFSIGAAQVEVGAGDLVIWTTGRVAKFEVLERLRKVTLLVPWSQMRERLNGRKQPPLGGKVDSRVGAGALLAFHLTTLSNEVSLLAHPINGPVLRSTLALLEAVLASQPSSDRSNGEAAILQKIQDYILRHMHDEALNLTRIAATNRISLRYLHALFKPIGLTVSEWILNQRLQACKRMLEDPAFAHSQIAEIAYRWGFNSTSHFCRVFKRKYRCNPGEVRRSARVADTEREVGRNVID